MIEHVGRARGRPQFPDRRILRVRILGVVGRQTDVRLIRDGQDGSLNLVCLTSHIIFSFTLSSSIAVVTSLQEATERDFFKTVLGRFRLLKHISFHSNAKTRP